MGKSMGKKYDKEKKAGSFWNGGDAMYDSTVQ